MNKIIPLARPDIRTEDINAVKRVLKSGMLVQGKEVLNLESNIAKFLYSSNCSAVSNGTASLHLALIALGIGPGDEVIVPAFSYVATANVVEIVGAKSVFIDINPLYFNIDEEKIEKAISPKTKAIIPVHEFGLCSNMPKIMEIALKHNIYVIEDAACALGATYENKFAGTFGDFGSFSLHPRKAISSGEGGLLVSNNQELDKKIKILRNHGIGLDSLTLEFVQAGFNYRMTDFQAALVNSQLSRLNKTLAYKEKLASIYLCEINNSKIILPQIPDKANHTWQTFHIILDSKKSRDNLSSFLKNEGILSNYGAQCIPSMKYYAEKYKFDAEKEYPFALRSYECGLAIPLYERLSESQIKRISRIINKF